MTPNFAIVKKRPVLTGSIIIGGGFLLYFLFMRGDSSAPSSGGGYQVQQIQAAQEVAAANNQMMAQAQQIQGQIAMGQLQANTAITIAEMEYAAQREMAAFSLEGMRYDYALNMEALSVQENLGMMQMESQLLQAQIAADQNIAMQQMMVQGQVNLAALSSQIQMAGIQSQENIARDTMAQQTNMASIFAQTQVALGKNDVEKMRIQAAAQKSGNKSNMWATVAMGAMMAFSDIKIKTIEGCVDSERCLKAIENAPVDFWRYLDGAVEGDGGEIHVGPYVQDFYRELGAKDWNDRQGIAIVDYMGALTGAVKALSARK